MKQFSDNELIRAYLHGNVQALNELFNRHYNAIRFQIYALVSDSFIGDDITQDAFLLAIIKIKDGKYIEDGKFIGWLSIVARNVCFDYFKKKRYDLVELEKFHQIPDISDTAIKVCNIDRDVILDKALKTIPSEQAEVLMLDYGAGLPGDQIATICQCSHNTMRGRKRYALNNIKKLLDKASISI